MQVNRYTMEILGIQCSDELNQTNYAVYGYTKLIKLEY